MSPDGPEISLKNDEWMSSEIEVDDPVMLPELPGFHVLVRPVSIKSKTNQYFAPRKVTVAALRTCRPN